MSYQCNKSKQTKKHQEAKGIYRLGSSIGVNEDMYDFGDLPTTKKH